MLSRPFIPAPRMQVERALALGARGAVYVWLLTLVVAPNLLLLVASFLSSSDGSVVATLTLSNYGSVFRLRHGGRSWRCGLC